MQRHTLVENAGATIIVCVILFTTLKAVLMNYYRLPRKTRVFMFSLKTIGKPQISGIENVGMRSYIRHSNLVNKFFYVTTAAILLLFFIINAALRQ